MVAFSGRMSASHPTRGAPQARFLPVARWGEFAFAWERAEKRRLLAEVDAALATDIEGVGAIDAVVA
ncbi:hypothetical protein [Bosea sp. UNC402CLCol]|uniref:hypothetical protein n=1 Tax=Bosea sp. UNC402CLCol TaxID=1510531 RepID=UPI00056EE510|nr:hypothetical protein [Bosea sp. UNC402CLCol]